MPAHKVQTDNGSYYREFLKDSEGRVVMGTGQTSEQAEEKAQVALRERELFFGLPPRSQLITMMAQDKLYDDDIQRCIRLLIGMVV